ncbi:putative ATP-dependent RNA helicase ucp12 [Saxophila tyrrhenica]|uniref:ATP-dependent RNA helicase ucp12 n=1 Tax=Saxophila tyrrhenica TaxID=1690608 RepID=A0AAV9P4Y9_9PEZI|nr:putative ATP-dependent RNA helicase ucp12 [Saxophila tyrrhenica]
MPQAYVPSTTPNRSTSRRLKREKEMVNKPHAPRAQGNKNNKKPVAATANGEDTSFIVFGNDKPSKTGKQDAPAPAAGSSAANINGKAATAKDGTQPEPEKKPDTRTLIAGSSWTGKLPMTLFNELCQKQKWEKPEYTIHRNASGFSGGVILRKKNPKTQEVTQLPPILPPLEYQREKAQESAIEARHFAAAYALFRVANMKNIHMTLPPQYRDLWKGDFESLKKEARLSGKGYLYEADPFLAKKQHDEAEVAKVKARGDKAKQQEEDKKQQVVSLDGQVQSKHVLRGWQKAPKVEMGLKTRREVERLVRSDGTWNSNGVRLSPTETRNICDDLSRIGFRRSHVEEATESCKDREECLEWLLIHVPEDDLPKWALPENYLAGVSLASGDLRKEGKLKRLCAAGYPTEVAADALEKCSGDEAKAAELLQSQLLEVEPDSSEASQASSETWDEELVTLEAILGDRFTNHDRICTISLELSIPAGKPVLLRARPPTLGYPEALPILSIEAELPAYIRLSILKRCLNFAATSLKGEQMLYSIVDWLEAEVPAIIDKPGKLSDIASATSAPSDTSRQAVSRTKARRRMPNPISWAQNTPASVQVMNAWQAKQATPEQTRMIEARQKLPAWRLQDAIVSSVNSNQVTIISGETGSGKSTQGVQFVLDDMIKRCFGAQANIICTQPRRISALGLADRVADERCGRVGDEVGYAIRGESKHKPGITKLQFVTTGVLLRRLQTSGGSPEDVVKSLADVSHIVIDEVHERSLDTDFLLVLLRDVLKKRNDLKLILMSATLDAAVFEDYFRGAATVGQVQIEGRTYPVQDLYLDDVLRMTGFAPPEEEDAADNYHDQDPRNQSNGPAPVAKALRAVGTRINYDLLARTVQYIDNELGYEDGGILIFLPGVGEINQAISAMRGIPGLYPLPLHASLQSSEQRLVFKKPSSGLRKVVAATNVAETSITIEDIVAVIDTGRVKETSFDPYSNMVKLAEVWASRAACKQRRGRAGRVRAGKCYKLYTRSAEAKMADRPEPEIRRVPLEQLCLSVKAMGVADVPAFLASALTPPESLAVDGALKLLGRMGALDGSEMTALGRHLSLIPADLRCGKLLVLGAAFGCLDLALTIAAILTVKSPFVNPQTKRDESKAARASFGASNGDLICDLRAYQEWSERRSRGEPTSSLRRWCDENFLSHQTLMDISTNRFQYVSSLKEIGFIPAHYDASPSSMKDPSRSSDPEALIRALVAGAFQPQVARIEFPDTKFAASSSGAVALDPEARTIKYFNEENGRVFVHPSSTLFDAQGFPGHSVFMSYFTKMATSKNFIRDLTPFNVYSLLMFSGPITIDPQGRGLLVDGWLRLRGWARIGVLVSRLRTILDDLLARKVDDPGMDMSTSAVVSVVRKLVELDGLDR